VSYDKDASRKDTVSFQEGSDSWFLTSNDAILRAQALVQSYIPAGESLADELIAERRAADK
jgi:hypothetical protein